MDRGRHPPTMRFSPVVENMRSNKPLMLTVGKRGLPIPSSLRSSAAA
jgi:hypothetical protein